MESLLASHTDAKEVSEANLSDIVGDVLIVLKVGVSDFGVPRGSTDVRLQ
jgi:hypothetical protein